MIRVKKVKFLRRCLLFFVEKNIQSTVSFVKRFLTFKENMNKFLFQFKFFFKFKLII